MLLSILTDSLARSSIKHLRVNSRCLIGGSHAGSQTQALIFPGACFFVFNVESFNKSGCWLQPRTHIRIITPSLFFTRLSLHHLFRPEPCSFHQFDAQELRHLHHVLAGEAGGMSGRGEREPRARAREMPAVAQVPWQGTCATWHTRLFASLGARDTTRMGWGAVVPRCVCVRGVGACIRGRGLGRSVSPCRPVRTC